MPSPSDAGAPRPPNTEELLVELQRREHQARVIGDFAQSLLQQKTLHDVVWTVVRQAIAKLEFEDCVVYLLDARRDVLVQAAAHGPKNPRSDQLLNPIEIPVGEGIVGAAAASREIQLVGDVRQDPRYIVDDAARCSELAVPMLYDDRVVGVLDSEHSQPHYFDQGHVDILRIVASMTASCIVARQTIEQLRGAVRRLSSAEEKLEQQAADLRAARDRAEHASRAKTMFLANMSHEVRTPLTSILGFSEQLGHDLGEVATPEQRDAVDTIARSGRYLLSLVNSILDLSKMEAGQVQVELRATDPRALLDDVRTLLQPQANSRGLTLRTSVSSAVPATVRTDSTRLQQILINVVGNAIKFSAPHSGDIDIHASIQSAGPQRQRLALRVEDCGPGIPVHRVARIFEEFEQGDAPSDLRDGGAGLGLPISRRLARLLGGDVTVEARDHGGSRFTITVALRGDEQDSSRGGNGPSNQRGAGHVLLVDDSPEVQRLVQRYLRLNGFEVSVAGDGQAALSTWQENPDLSAILMDMRMPRMDGYATTAALRKAGCAVPIIALTAHAMRDDELRCRQAGCTGYLTKPFALADLLSALHGHTVASD